MKRLIGFFAISGLLIAPNLDSCLYLNERWHDQSPATVNDYQSPTPEHNITIPTDEGSASREIIDTFSQEDHSNQEGDGLDQVLTDQPLEEHLEDMVECDDSGTEDEDYPKLPCDKTLHYDTRNGFNPNQKLTRDDVFGSGTGENHYTIKNTSGMIYKTDQLTCDTAYEHPTTGFTSGKPGEETNHNYVVNDAGELSYNSDDKYCFYLMIPGNGDSDGKIAPVHQDDKNSILDIKRGDVPYLSLDEEYLNKLEAGTGGLSFVNGRYISPMPEGKILLPTNGTNLLFTRSTVYRPYMQDLHRRDVGGAVELQTANTLDATTFDPAREKGGKSEFFNIGGEDFRMTGLNHNTSLVTQPSSEYQGRKLSGAGEPEGPQYLAVGPEGSPDKQLNVALHFPNNDTEREYLEKITNGSFEPNEVREEIDANRGHRLLNDDRSKELSKAVLFQLKVNRYSEPGVTPFDPNLLEGTPTLNCDEADEATQVFCVKYAPFRRNLEKLYDQLGIENGEGGTEALQAKLNGPLNSNIVVGGKNWKVSAARAAIGQFYNDAENKKFVWLLDTNNPERDETKPGFGNYIRKTQEGIMQRAMYFRIMGTTAIDAQRISQENLVNKEHEEYISKVEEHKSKSDDELKNGLRTIVTTRYEPFETDNVTKGAFWHYTTQDDEGKQLLTRLGLIQRGINYSNPANTVAWQAHIPDSLFGRCRVTPVSNTTVEDCKAIITADEIAPEPTNLNSRLDPQAAPLPVEVMPN